MRKTEPGASMRVLLISPWIQLGGSESLVLRLAHLLRSRGCRVSVACCFVNPSLMEAEVSGIHFIRPWSWISALSRRNRAALLLLGVPALLWIVIRRARRYDLLNPHNFPSLWIAACAFRLAGVPFVWHFNEPAPIPGWFKGIERRAAGLALGVTVLDDRSRSRVGRTFQREAIVVHPGVDLTFWGGHAGRAAPRGPSTLLTVGKIHPQKNQVMLVEVLAVLAADLPQLRLVITGEGPDRRRVERRVEELNLTERVVFTGMVDAATLRALYRAAFLVCFPALDQTWGLTPFEALCQKTVSLVSSQSGAAEVLGPQGIGLVADPDVASFATAIRRAHETPDQIGEMGERGLAYVRQSMSWEGFGDRMLEVFRLARPGLSRAA